MHTCLIIECLKYSINFYKLKQLASFPGSPPARKLIDGKEKQGAWYLKSRAVER